MSREELKAMLAKVVSEAEQFGERDPQQVARVEQLKSHAATVVMCVDHLFDFEENHPKE